jgi:CHAT domain-containing protein/Tfp pilus assembly protein PilF
MRYLVPILALVVMAHPIAASVQVESVERSSAAEAAGLQVGDRIDRWAQQDSGGELPDRPSFLRLSWNQAQRGSVEFLGTRQGRAMKWKLGSGWIGMSVVSDDPEADSHDPLFTAWTHALSLEDEGDRTEALRIVVDALSTIDHNGDGLLYATFAARAGMLSRRLGQFDAAEEYLQTAMELQRTLAPGSHALAETLQDYHLCFFSQGDLEAAASPVEEAIELFEAMDDATLDAARARNNMGRVQLIRGDHDAARESFLSALEVFERIDVDPLDRSRALTNLGVLGRRSGNLEEAQKRFEAALAIHEATDPLGAGTAILLNNLGTVAFDRGDLLDAERFIGQSLALREKAEPGSLNVALYLSNLGGLAVDRGDLAKAELLLLRALEIRQAQAPRSIDEAATLGSLSSLYAERGELGRARENLERSLEISMEVAPDGIDEADSRQNLAQIAVRQGDLDFAQNELLRALELREKLAPQSADHASNLAALANLHHLRAEDEQALARLDEALQIDAVLASGGVRRAAHLLTQAQVLSSLGRDEEAIAAASEGQRLRAQHMPGTHWEAQAWQRLARVAYAAGQRTQALRSIQQARDILDQRGSDRVTAARSRMGFRARMADIYGDCVLWESEDGNVDAALADLERARARVFMEMLAERDLDFAADLPAPLRAERRRVLHEIDRQLENQFDGEPIDEEAMARITAERERIDLEIRAQAPALASLENPQPLSAPEIRSSLPEGVLLLSYLVSEEQTLLCAVDSKSTEFYVIPLAREELGRAVGSLREHIEATHNIESESEALYAALLGPVRERVAAALQLLISPDGPLHLLPFAALRHDGRYLIESTPLHFVDSATVYAQLRRREQISGSRIAVFADPELGNDEIQVALADDGRRDRALRSLSHARDEAATIAALFPERETQLFESASATEARVKSLTGDYGLLHFATHGLADGGSGLGSCLVLRSGEDENGLLQAAEILESSRLQADLVTLSACETALGEEFGGEGLLGLVRAFEYAGARSVVASLWAVSDRATAELMADFYEGLRSGLGKDEALRRAQLQMLGSSEAAGDGAARGVGAIGDSDAGLRHPFYWAAFQLFGDPSPSVLARSVRK